MTTEPVPVVERCALTELLPDQCACPRHRGGPTPDLDLDEPQSPVFAARFPGCCGACGSRIHEGDPIRAWGSGYRHERCPS